MLTRGCVILSLAGRDKGRLMAVIKADTDGTLWVADGKERPLARPKRKNPRHAAEIRRRLEESSMATNRELRRALALIGGGEPAYRPSGRDGSNTGGGY